MVAKQSVVIVSLGCNKNLVDSEVMAGILSEKGYELVASPSEANIGIVNTCGFIESAKQESVDAILDLVDYAQSEQRPSVLIVAGCLSQRYADELLDEFPEVNAVVGTGEFFRIDEILDRVYSGERVKAVGTPSYLYDHRTPRLLSTPRHYAYLKIADGCNNRCSYCAIPSIRGCMRSRKQESVVFEARALADAGCKELILVAQDTTAYGVDLYGRPALLDLVRAVSKVDGIEWIRLLYTYPTRITDDLLRVIADEPKVVRYLDIPIQHVNKRILASMNRSGDRASLSRMIGRIREAVPGVTIRTSLIVGYPGETDDEFSELLEFVAEQELDRVGVFIYSQEEGTPAGQMPDQVPEQVKKERYAELMELQKSISLKKMKRRIGSVERVIIDGVSEESSLLTVGRSEGEAPEVDGLIYIGNAHPQPGSFVNVRLTDASEYDLVGEVVDTPDTAD
ncbi:MAG: 30S ribosomal protein S12 methylthiotransferase RimO [Bacillota bacterium]|nr:30S ribosomal protein S12 methylthiotransferase RimO [Bacillota bacterium]